MLGRILQGVLNSEGEFVSVRVVRLGQTNEDTDTVVKEATLDYKADMMARDSPKYAELCRTNAAIKDLRLQLHESAANPEHVRYQLGTALRTRVLLEAAVDRIKAEHARLLLQSADVVVSTLSSSGQQQVVEHVVASRIRFDVVIVDEAAQTTEPSVLIPLRYGCNQLILVGDPRQLPPTVLSDSASSAGLSMSLFERLERSEHEVLMLTGTIFSCDTQQLSTYMCSAIPHAS
jgi:hypothetical protein